MNCSNPSDHNAGREHGQALCQCLSMNDVCIKCGSKNINERYAVGGWENCPVHRRQKHIGISGLAPCKDVKEEHLEIKCKNCGYEWNKPTKDSKKVILCGDRGTARHKEIDLQYCIKPQGHYDYHMGADLKTWWA